MVCAVCKLNSLIFWHVSVVTHLPFEKLIKYSSFASQSAGLFGLGWVWFLVVGSAFVTILHVLPYSLIFSKTCLSGHLY